MTKKKPASELKKPGRPKGNPRTPVTTAPPQSQVETLTKLGSGRLSAGVRIASTVAVQILESGDAELIARLFPDYPPITS